MDNFAVPLMILGGLALVLLIWLMATYNRLVSVRQHMRESWSDIDVELKRRYDLIPNLVETVKGYATHERTVLENVVRLRNQAAANHGPADAQASDESALSLGVKQLFAVAENYPQLRADAHFLALQEELAITEDRLAAARRFFNGNVRELNQMCESFPATLVARMFGFERASYFELSSEAERVVPRASLAS